MKLNKYNYFVLIGIILFLYILSKLNWGNIIDIFKTINFFYLIIAVIFLPLLVFFRGLRWYLIIKSLNLHLSLRNSCFGYLVGSSFGAVTPGRIGNFFRVKILKDTTDASTVKSLFTLIFDNLFNVITLILFSIFSFLLFFLIFKKSLYSPIYIVILLAILVFLYLLTKEKILMKFKPLVKFFINYFIPSKFKDKVKIGIKEFLEITKEANKKSLLLAFFISIISFTASVLCGYFIALSLNIKISFIAILIFLSISSFIAALPISISGLGTREATLIFLMSFVGISAERAVSFSLLTIFLVNWLFAIVGSIILFRYKKIFKRISPINPIS